VIVEVTDARWTREVDDQQRMRDRFGYDIFRLASATVLATGLVDTRERSGWERHLEEALRPCSTAADILRLISPEATQIERQVAARHEETDLRRAKDRLYSPVPEGEMLGVGAMAGE
jgi:hypothetical protein